MSSNELRKWMVRWLYGTAAAHLLVGVALAWWGDLSVFESYHRYTEAAFWGGDAPSAARTQQVWWIALFGPTIQGLSLWMGAIVYFGARYRNPFAWGVLILGILVWGPQDMLISLQASNWVHVWIDGFALLTMLPPLFWLWQHDRCASSPSIGREAA